MIHWKILAIYMGHDCVTPFRRKFTTYNTVYMYSRTCSCTIKLECNITLWRWLACTRNGTNHSEWVEYQ